jgi:hypothetical protein
MSSYNFYTYSLVSISQIYLKPWDCPLITTKNTRCKKLVYLAPTDKYSSRIISAAMATLLLTVS